MASLEFDCSSCPSTFSSLSELFQHTTEKKHKCDRYCSTCKGWFPSKQLLLDHLSMTKHMLERYCLACKRVFGHETDLKSHKAKSPKHKAKPEVDLQCQVCKRVFKQKAHLQQHQRDTNHAASQPHAPAPAPVLAPAPVQRPAGMIIEPAPPVPPLELLEPQNRSDAFTTLTANERRRVGAFLIDNCHAAWRLKQEGFYWVGYDRPVQPPSGCPRVSELVPMPPVDPKRPKLKVIVIGCTMASVDNLPEPAWFCAMDFLTGQEILEVDVSAGTNGNQSSTSRAVVLGRGRTRDKWAVARMKLLKRADANTIIVGHEVQETLCALGVSHARIIDTAILTAEPVFGPNNALRYCWSLDTLCQGLLGLSMPFDAQEPSRDLPYVRELVLKCTTDPIRLWSWARCAGQELLGAMAGQSGASRKRKRAIESGHGPESGLRSGHGPELWSEPKPAHAAELEPEHEQTSRDIFSSSYLPEFYGNRPPVFYDTSPDVF